MGINNDALMVMQGQLYDRIDQIIANLPCLSPGSLAGDVDQIRQIARDCGLVPLSELARGLGRALSGSEGAAAARPFLETMRDAVGCERLDAAATQSFLASINLRLHG
jgi:hypothetical protein